MSKAREKEDYVSGAGEVGIVSEKTYRHDELFEMENGSPNSSSCDMKLMGT